MFALLFIILYNGVTFAAYPETIMDFEIHPDSKGCNSNYITLLEGESLKIRVVNEIQNINVIRCSVQDQTGQHDIVYRQFERDGSFLSITLDKVPDYGNAWDCTFWDKYAIVAASCIAKFHLKTINPAAQISVNMVPVVATTSRSEWHYDAAADYWFEEDETVFIDCSGPTYAGKVMVRLSDNTGRNILNTDYIPKQAKVQLKLSRDYDKLFVECKYKSTDESKTRLFLHMQNPGPLQSIITFHVNGMRVRATSRGDKTYMYQHTYYEGDKVQISCQIRNDNSSHLYLQYKKQEISSRLQIVNHTLVLNNEDNDRFLECAAMDGVGNNKKEILIIRFVKIPLNFYITGLVQGNILQQYPESIQSSVLHYQYSDSDPLQLTCTSRVFNRQHSELKFTFNDIDVPSTLTKDKGNEYSRYHVFILQASQNNSNIKCLYKYGYTKTLITIKLICREAPVSPDNDNAFNNTNNGSGDNDNGNNDNGVIHKENDSNGSSDIGKYKNKENISNAFTNWICLAIGIVILISIIAIISCVVIRYMKKKAKSIDTEYLTINRVNDKNMNVDDKTEPILHYAELMPVNNNSKFTKKQSPEYAQIIAKSNQKNVCDYENMCQSARYVNSKVDEELTEPAYCEVLLPRT